MLNYSVSHIYRAGEMRALEKQHGTTLVRTWGGAMVRGGVTLNGKPDQTSTRRKRGLKAAKEGAS